MPPSLFLYLAAGVSIIRPSPSEAIVQGTHSRTTICQLGFGANEALLMLAEDGQYEDVINENVLRRDGYGALLKFNYFLGKLIAKGHVLKSVQSDGIRLLTALQTSSQLSFAHSNLCASDSYILSRFAYIRRDGAQTVLESPLSCTRFVLTDQRIAGLIYIFSKSTSLDDARLDSCGLDIRVVRLVATLLVQAGMLIAVSQAGEIEEERKSALRTWEFQDLLIHQSSRSTLAREKIGATYRFAGSINPPPARKVPISGAFLNLYRPNIELLKREEKPFSWVFESRRSIRNYGDSPISGIQLGEFLYRVARVTSETRRDVETPGGTVEVEWAARPYPSGGSLYELEIYLLINSCRGIDSGTYYYDPEKHRLSKLPVLEKDFEAITKDAGKSAQIKSEAIQVLFIITSRFQRVGWKYEKIAYALTLKNVGVLYQSMYLVATAMGLAPCALGAGDALLFSTAIGTDFYGESSVGEFLLGSRNEEIPIGIDNDQ